MTSYLSLKHNSRTPKYVQIAETLISNIRNRGVQPDEPLPSINYLSAVLDVSRDTVEKAYKELRRKNMVEAVPGKGYFIKESTAMKKKRIFLLFNKLSAHKRNIYEAMMETLAGQVDIDFHVYNNDFTIFKQLLLNRNEGYSHYVIIPHFYRNFFRAYDIINRVPKDRLLLLDKRVEGISGDYACVYQDFEQNIYDAMTEARELFAKYHTIKLLFPARAYQPREIIKGFQRFCIEHQFQGKLVSKLDEEPIEAGEAYITMTEDDLVLLVKRAKKAKLKVGRQIGILSYNENPLKEILLDGITVMSTDFRKLGQTAAELILSGRKEHIENPFRLIVRNSL